MFISCLTFPVRARVASCDNARARTTEVRREDISSLGVTGSALPSFRSLLHALCGIPTIELFSSKFVNLHVKERQGRTYKLLILQRKIVHGYLFETACLKRKEFMNEPLGYLNRRQLLVSIMATSMAHIW